MIVRAYFNYIYYMYNAILIYNKKNIIKSQDITKFLIAIF